MKTMKLFTMLLLAMGIAFTSCEGPEGPEGPEGEMGLTGETGAQGEAGAAGEQGAQGEPGEDGNANVIASDWIDAGFDTSASSTFDEFSISVPELTREIADSAIILVYGRDDLSTRFEVHQLPYVQSHEKYDYHLEGSLLHEYELFITGTTMDGNDQFYLSVDKVRYVIVPSGTAKSASVNLYKMSYEEVMDHFGLD